LRSRLPTGVRPVVCFGTSFAFGGKPVLAGVATLLADGSEIAAAKDPVYIKAL
jgi:hypothetical protein